MYLFFLFCFVILASNHNQAQSWSSSCRRCLDCLVIIVNSFLAYIASSRASNVLIQPASFDSSLDVGHTMIKHQLQKSTPHELQG